VQKLLAQASQVGPTPGEVVPPGDRDKGPRHVVQDVVRLLEAPGAGHDKER